VADVAGPGGSTVPGGELTADDFVLFIALFVGEC